jgi:gamma-glutamyl hercynylcysteine S-oxide synthase
MDSRVEIRAALEHARSSTEALLEPVSDSELTASPSPLAFPLVWELARVAHFEETWLRRNLQGQPALSDAHADVYDALRRERVAAPELPPLRPDAVRAYAADVRERVLSELDHVDLDAANPLLRKAFVYGLVLQHELQHQETILESLQLRTAGLFPVRDAEPPDRARSGPDEVRIDGGSFILGATDEPWAYDNELVPHEVELAPYAIDRVPVTNADFAEFVDDGGYSKQRSWSADGWAWRQSEGASAPLHWERANGGWERTRFGVREPVPPEEPVQHVSFFEAEAFARWAGKRLPTEAEWERAAAWDPRRGKSRYPWGREFAGYEANLGRARFSPAPVGSYAGGVSPSGCVQLTGDVWEWTTSYFEPYPGFLSYPYPEYSEIYFGEAYRVLRGGSWATAPLVARSSFRNWESPGRREIFAGFRCARDL